MSGINKANQRQSSRHKARYDGYRNSQTREVNKAIKLGRHLTRQPEDKTALTAMENISSIVRKRAGVGELYHNLTR